MHFPLEKYSIYIAYVGIHRQLHYYTVYTKRSTWQYTSSGDIENKWYQVIRSATRYICAVLYSNFNKGISYSIMNSPYLYYIQ